MSERAGISFPRVFFLFLFCGFFQITVGAYFLRENQRESPVLRTFARLSAVLTTRASSRLAHALSRFAPRGKNAKKEKSRKLGESRERGGRVQSLSNTLNKKSQKSLSRTKSQNRSKPGKAYRGG